MKIYTESDSDWKNGILTAYELVKQSDIWLNKQIGIRGLEMKHELLGEMVSPVSNEIKLPKSIQKTSAMAKFTSDKEYIKNSLNYHISSMLVRSRTGRIFLEPIRKIPSSSFC